MPKVTGSRNERATALSSAVAQSIKLALQKAGSELDEQQRINIRIGMAVIEQATARQIAKGIEDSILAATAPTSALHKVAGK